MHQHHTLIKMSGQILRNSSEQRASFDILPSYPSCNTPSPTHPAHSHATRLLLSQILIQGGGFRLRSDYVCVRLFSCTFMIIIYRQRSIPCMSGSCINSTSKTTKFFSHLSYCRVTFLYQKLYKVLTSLSRQGDFHCVK